MAGRKRKYTTEVLESIVDEYFNKTAVFGQVSATDIANFAINELGYKDIRYFHFTRNNEIKELISEVNNLYQEGNIENNNVLIEFNPDKFMKTYENDKKTQIIVLRHFADRYNELNHKVLELEHLKNQIEIELCEIKNENKKLKEKNKELNQEIKKIKDRNINLNKFAILEEQLKMREYIKEKNLFNGFDEENLMIVLEKCGFKPNKIDEEEVFETIANTNITNEEDKQNSEQKEIDEVMREIEDLI